ncbi:unnamed protein product [Allacma fusca]|uniref:Glycine N-acyltransferase-like protein n=1 Tax=Allacma fusca TaxID=39272 RepID=A0A8J2JU89_9HEXA|nr:unnamed protein product [Allacma fusca]
MIYNILKQNKSWKSEHQWFTLQDLTAKDVWVVVTYVRKDYGQVICISRPPNAQVTPEIRTAFSNCEFIDWSESFMAACIETPVSDMISSISIRDKGNCTEIHPCYVYSMDPEEALQLNIPSGNYEIKSIDTEEGIEFLLKTWKYAMEGSRDYVENCLKRNLSFGVYINNEIVADVIFDCHGLIGMLYSLPEYRGQGLGQLVMRKAMKESAAHQFVPGSTVEKRNIAARTFMERVGYKVAAEVDYLFYNKPTY